MSIYNEVLVAYDVEVNKFRTKLFKRLKDYGLIPIQKSVFWGRLTKAEIAAVERLFPEFLKGENDRAFIVRADFADQISKGGFGYGDGSLFKEELFAVV